jgi:flagellar export protein FliJ
MPFRFSLEGVLSYRKNLEHAEELTLNKILQEIAAKYQQLQKLQNDHRSLREQRDHDLAKAQPAVYLQELAEKEQYIERVIETVQAQLQELDSKREAQLTVLRAAQQDREVLDEVRKQKHDAYQLEQNRREQKTLDDLFLSRIKDGN